MKQQPAVCTGINMRMCSLQEEERLFHMWQSVAGGMRNTDYDFVCVNIYDGFVHGMGGLTLKL